MLVPAAEYPGFFVFYKMFKAGLLCGLPSDVDISSRWLLVTINDDARTKTFVEKHPGKLTGKFRHVPDAFGRLLAKVGYCHILTSLDLDDFRPICLPYIMGDNRNVSYVVGGSQNDQTPELENGYSLKTVAVGSRERLLLIALVRLLANTHAPAYHVVVGDVLGAEHVRAITSKLGVEPADMSPHSPHGGDAHWLPEIWPLPA
jgi:hypothetical protein